MSDEQGREQVAAAAPGEPPVTGNAMIDAALRQVADLADVPVEQHHDRLQRVQDLLNEVLESSRNGGQPGVPGPRAR